MVIGYTTGVFDLFHIGHLNVIRNSKAMCDRLIVGVTTDDLLLDYKKRKPVVPFTERCEIVRSIKGVDVVILGSRGFRGIKGKLLGSVSRKVSHAAECTCIIVK